MAAVAQVKDGKLVYDYTDNSKEKLPTGSKLGYDQFLQILCAEMQYQDPLEPTSNTEYVAQLATFSQLEAMLSLQNTQQGAMANDLVGKTVIMKVSDDVTGESKYVDGRVDYTMYQDGKIYLSVNDKLYPLEDLDTVADEGYYEAMGLAKSLANMLGQLPDVYNITADYAEMIDQITELYDGMTDYQKQFVSAENVTALQEYQKKVEEEKNKVKDVTKKIAEELEKKFDALPAVEDVTLDNEDAINEILETYDGLSKYQKEIIGEDITKKVESYREKLKELKEA